VKIIRCGEVVEETSRKGGKFELKAPSGKNNNKIYFLEVLSLWKEIKGKSED